VSNTATALRAGLAPRRSAPGEDPAWLAGLRDDALTWVADHGFPTTKDEDWRYTRLGPILEIPLEPAAGGGRPTLEGAALDELAGQLGGIRLVFVNGFLAPGLSTLDELPSGAVVTNLASRLTSDAADIEPMFSRPHTAEYHAFVALNTAWSGDGALIELPPDCTIEAPVHLVFLADAEHSAVVANPRSLVVVGARSRVTVVETYIGLRDDTYLTNAVTEFVLAEGAAVEHYKVQNESEQAFHLALVDVQQGRDSTFCSHAVALGAAIARHEVSVLLGAEGADASLDGLFMPSRTQHHDNPTVIDHAAPHCTSRELYKGVMDGRGHGVFNGRVIVRVGADGTDASQLNKNLLLTDYAEVDTRPRLEILADDVKCTHGAAVGQLDEEAVFYLQSRGIAQPVARGLLTYAFVNEMLARVRIAPLRAHLERLVAMRLPVAGNPVEGNEASDDQ
jgi:Fe-S cluster assembly protein SufD